MRAFLCAIALLAVPVHGLRSRREVDQYNHSAEISSATNRADCDALNRVIVGGRDFGDAVNLVCKVWPKRMGEFPVKRTNQVVAIVDKAVGEAGLWDKIKELTEKRKNNREFCWRRFNFQRQNGQCPPGYKTGKFVGAFAPLCKTDCSQAVIGTGCGLACASSRGRCIKTFFNQVGEVVRSVGKVASFSAKNPRIAEIVDELLQLAEFAAGPLFELVKVAKKLYKMYKGAESKAAVVIVMLQFLIENAKSTGKNLMELKRAFGETLDLITELMDMEFKWFRVDFKFITSTILKHGAEILDASYEVTKAFTYPRCQLKNARLSIAANETEW